MVSKSTIKRLISAFKNVRYEDITLIQSLYVKISGRNYKNITYISEITNTQIQDDFKLLKELTHSNSNKIQSLLARGRLSTQYVYLLKQSNKIETKILQSINAKFKPNQYYKNLYVFGNKKPKPLTKTQRRKQSYLNADHKENYSINSYIDLLEFIDKFNEDLRPNKNIRFIRIVAKYSNENGTNEFISTKLLSSHTKIFDFLNNLNMLLESYIQYSDFTDYELSEIIVFYYLNHYIEPIELQ